VLQSVHCMARDLWEHPVRPISRKKHRFPPSGKPRETLNVQEARTAIALLLTRSRDMADAVELAIYTGLRKNELATLVWGRIDLAARRATVLAKRKARQDYRERTVSLSTPAVALLAERRPADVDPNARVFKLTNFRKLWVWARAQIGRREVHWHDLRHTHGTLLGMATDVRIIKDQMGHTNIATTLRYVRADEARQLEAVETIPALSDRKVVALRPDAESEAKPPAATTSRKRKAV
jgi:integrase